jgi:Flp pilus assembly protein TadD/glutathione synthase/RimK-type ligase-like ATP-grasp enzyme
MERVIGDASKPATLAIRVECGGMPSEAALEQLETLLEANPEAVDLRFARACCLEELGRTARARGAYQGVLARDPAHFGALINLATLYFTAGKHVEARVLYAQAVRRHPDDPTGHINLANVEAETGNDAAAKAGYEAALRIDPQHPTAHFALSLLLARGGDRVGARRHHALAFASPIVRVAPYYGTAPPLRLLQLLAANGGNVVTTLLLDDRVVETTTLVADSDQPGFVLPPHDVLFNAIGDADRSDDALAAAERIAARSGSAIVNPPTAVRVTGRSQVARRLDGIAGVIAPRTALLARSNVTVAGLAARGFGFPLLLRSPGHHMGHHFERIEGTDELAATVARLPGGELFAIAYLDARGADGQFRKYRMLFIDGALYPLHLAIAPQWKIHYFSADMRDRPENRAEEEAFLADPRAALPARAWTALESIAAALGLDYGGIDFGLDAAGNVLVFEANATMAIYLPDADERFAYRRPAVDQALAAVRAMFVARAARAGYRPA